MNSHRTAIAALFAVAVAIGAVAHASERCCDEDTHSSCCPADSADDNCEAHAVDAECCCDVQQPDDTGETQLVIGQGRSVDAAAAVSPPASFLAPCLSRRPPRPPDRPPDPGGPIFIAHCALLL